MAEAAESTKDIWSSLLTQLSSDDRITPQLHGFISLVEPKGVMAGTLYLEVPNELTRGMLEQRIRLPLLSAISTLDDSFEVATFAIVVNPEIQPDPLERTDAADEQPYIETTVVSAIDQNVGSRKSDSRLNPKYSFDNFVIGASNRFAHAAAVAVAEAPAKAYNPLFIYGESGLGKTHLLHAIGHYAISLYPGIRVRYVSSEEFTNDFINSIANNRASVFQSRYREIDILLIDDIQFLQGKDSTQEAFFHTFNTLHDHNKQVVITSDLPPKHLTGFEDRMRSRFEWGLITDVQAPDLELRIAILRKKAAKDGMTLQPGVKELIASKIQSNIRELEGALIRVVAFASLNKQEIDLKLAEIVLKDLISESDRPEITASIIMAVTAEYFGVANEDLTGSSRTRVLVTARQIAMYLCRELTELSLPKIGQTF
ncbi:MAG: chromosomal replication initiator protein, partial [Actinomycetota bacterium]|nr:chromosomal replication initiator protein [Actinomycetota bacterium]